MSREVSFSFDSPEEKQEYLHYAKSKGMTLSALVKMALYQYRAKYPCKSKKGSISIVSPSKVEIPKNCTALTAYGTTGGGLDPETQSTQEEGANDKV